MYIIKCTASSRVVGNCSVLGCYINYQDSKITFLRVTVKSGWGLSYSYAFMSATYQCQRYRCLHQSHHLDQNTDGLVVDFSDLFDQDAILL